MTIGALTQDLSTVLPRNEERSVPAASDLNNLHGGATCARPWKVDLGTGTISPVPTKGIGCLSEGFGA